MIKAPILIFDFDGTIADTHHYIVEISNRLCAEFNYARNLPHELDDLKNKTVHEVIRHLNVPLLKIPAIVARAKKEFQNDIATLKPVSGLQEILTRIKEAGIKTGILSSNAKDNITRFLKNHHLDIFDFIQSTSSIWGKHICLNKLLSQNQIDRNDIIYIGDELRDIDAAKKLGVKVAAVTWGYNSAAALQKLNPDYLIQTPADLLGLIGLTAPSS